MTVNDLIGIPWKLHGRDKNGYDCYGLAIEVEARLGKKLNDIYYENNDAELCKDKAFSLNVRPTQKLEVGNIIQMTLNNELHLGVIITPLTFIHATRNQGVRISKIGAIPYNAIYEVI
jgi:cell wall-associated NlpC family hydrolase